MQAGLAPAQTVILVTIRGACQYHFFQGRLAGAYLCSTSAAAPSELADSGGTPRGLHAVAEKHGDGAPLGQVFKARKPAGASWRELPESIDGKRQNLVTTRILWLRGLEPGLNAGEGRDTYQRYIYIHGTNRVDALGSPASGGCVLLRDAEIAALYDAVPVGSHVWIE